MVEPLELLQRGEAHLWFASPEEVTEPRLLGAFEDWLSPDERMRLAQFRRPEDQRRYLVRRALVRTVLSAYLHADPSALRFIRNEHGRPELEWPATAPALKFSLSKAEGMIACCVAVGCDIGIDAADLERRVDFVKLATRFFSAGEAAELLRHPEPLRQRRFFEYWTLKEAYVKARGIGLSLPLDQFWFQIGSAPTVFFDPSLSDNASCWQFEHCHPTSRHLIAVAIRKGPNPALRLIVRHHDAFERGS